MLRRDSARRWSDPAAGGMDGTTRGLRLEASAIAATASEPNATAAALASIDCAAPTFAQHRLRVGFRYPGSSLCCMPVEGKVAPHPDDHLSFTRKSP